jgi:hypothetical protein
MGKLVLHATGAKPRSTRPRKWSTIVGVLTLGLLVAFPGCKTSEDAKAAATQLTQTAQTLTQYYASLDKLLAETDEINTLRAIVNPAEPYSDVSKSYLSRTRAEIQKREALAAALTKLAGSFAQLSGSTAATDVPTAAANLESAVESLNLSTTVKMSAGQLQLMKDALGLIVSAVQQHKEREAGRQVDAFAGHLATWFEKEELFCDSIGANYADASAVLAHLFVRNKQIDPSASLSVALQPYGIAPHVTDPELLTKLVAQADAQIDTESAAIAAGQKEASKAMEQALTDMTSRMHALATGKPMSFRMAPPTLTDVQNWINYVPQISSVPAS